MAAYNRSDYDKSLKLLRPVAEKGDARAQYLVGRQYQFGQGVKADRTEAYFWYKRAEAKGHLEAKLFRQLLEKRWKISGDEKGRAEKKLAALNAPPKPAPSAIAEATHKATAEKPKEPERKIERPKAEKAKAEKPKPEKAKPEKTETAALKEKAKPAPSSERARPEQVASKSRDEAPRAKPPEPPKFDLASKTKVEPNTPPPEKTTAIAARDPEETTSSAPRSTPTIARLPSAPLARDDDDDDDDRPRQRASAPPPESRMPAAAMPNRPPPPSYDDGAHYPQSHAPAPYYAPPAPYYAPSPYYAPAAPPSWRGHVYYGPRGFHRAWPGPRHHVGYMHPGWRGFRRW